MGTKYPGQFSLPGYHFTIDTYLQFSTKTVHMLNC